MTQLATVNPEVDLLHIDDSDMVIELIRKSLTREIPDLNYHSVKTSEEAINRLKLNQYRLILVDLIMKNNAQAGLEFIEKIINQVQGTIFLYTAFECPDTIRQAIESLSRQRQNFPVFLEEKHDNYQTLAQFVSQYLKLYGDADLPSEFIALIRELDQTLEGHRNRKIFEQGRIFFKGKEKLEALREKLKQEIQKLSERNKNSPTALQLQRQYDKIKGEWHIVLSKYLPISLSSSTIFNYYRYYLEFSNAELFPHVEKVPISQYQRLLSIYNFSTPTQTDIPELVQRKENLNAQERHFFKDLIIQASPKNAYLKKKFLDIYFEIRQELWEQKADIPPEFVFRLATQYSAEGAIKRLPQLIEAWNQEGGVKALHELLPPFRLQAEEVDRKQLTAILGELQSPKEGWQTEAYYQYFQGNLTEALDQLEASELIVYMDFALSTRLLINFHREILKAAKKGKHHELLAYSLHQFSSFNQEDYENLLLYTLEIEKMSRNDGKILFILESSHFNVLKTLITEWRNQLSLNLEQQRDEFYQLIVDPLINSRHLFLLNVK